MHVKIALLKKIGALGRSQATMFSSSPEQKAAEYRRFAPQLGGINRIPLMPKYQNIGKHR
jgi:hypothetical protein